MGKVAHHLQSNITRNPSNTTIEPYILLTSTNTYSFPRLLKVIRLNIYLQAVNTQVTVITKTGSYKGILKYGHFRDCSVL